MPTAQALIAQQPGNSVATAWPQVSPNGVGPQDLDLLQIVDQGGLVQAKVDFAGNVLGGTQSGLAITSVSVTSFAVTQVTASTGVILGTFTGGAANAFAGKSVAILGFSNSGNNGTKVIISSSATQIVVATAGLVDETASATASVYGVSTAVYHGTIANPPSVGTALTVTGFTNAVNNVSGTSISAANGTTITVPFAGQIAETASATASIAVASTNGTRVGVFFTRLTGSQTIAALFGDAFSNPSQLDILQVIQVGGNIHYSLSYQGVASGS